MKILTIIVAGIALLLMLSTLICGLWIKSKGLAEESALHFHMRIGFSTVIFGTITIILLMLQVFGH